MNAKRIALLVATIAIVAVAWKVSEDKAPQTEVSRTVFFPGLIDRLNTVDRLSLRSARHETLLSSADGGWVIANRDGYPANDGDVRRTLLQVAALRAVEPKTRSPERYGRLGVDDVGADAGEDAGGTLVAATDADGATVFSLIVGHAREGGGGDQYYVREPGEAESWLVQGALDVPADPIRWLDATIVDVDTARVRSVSITVPDGKPVHIEKEEPDDSFFALSDVPEGFEPKSKATVSSIGAILLDLRFNDVRDAAAVAALEPARTVEVRTFDGLVVELREYLVDDTPFAHFAFSVDAEAVAAAEAGESAGDEAAASSGESATEQTDEPRESVAEEAARLTAHTSGWVYELPAYKRRMIDRDFDDLISEKTPEDDAESP